MSRWSVSSQSRALAVQARTLELLQSVGVADALVAKGNTSARLMLHFEGGGPPTCRLAGSQRQTCGYHSFASCRKRRLRRTLGEHLTANGVTIERGIELGDFDLKEDGVEVALRFDDGRVQSLRTAYLVAAMMLTAP